MVQIKVTPEMLEEVANRASNTRIALESIHNNLCNEIDRLCFQWIGASNQQFVQMFNDARPKAFTSINSIIKVEEDLKRIAEKFRNADDQDVTMEEGAMCGKPSSEEKGFDGKKLARDIAGEISGEYDIKRAWDGVDPSTGEKLSTWDRIFAGGMAVAGLTPVGKIAKVGKGVKMTANAVESVKNAEKAAEGIKNTERVAEAKNIPGRGYHKEVYANKPVKVQDAVTKWDEFLGTGTHTNIHPRTGLEDADRIFSADGTRSIRFGSHEMNSKPSKFHYHEETWTYDPVNNVMNVDNTLVRVPYKK
ncbi:MULTISPECIES: WXG100 family type VII secretion target [Bacillus cereus group]|uniref:WXG100 family type VII secretion target n=1 Tax=Bacillus thuringiensis TaxID=1428 RepID=A0A1C4FED0_BACTU|nr:MULTISPECIES: WXG100 family type VII secretion target [Bacillus cereus group]SCC54349.1 WXG100 family type VII secretion target [Bacillus thuringiensis]